MRLTAKLEEGTKLGSPEFRRQLGSKRRNCFSPAPLVGFVIVTKPEHLIAYKSLQDAKKLSWLAGLAKGKCE